MLARLSSAAVLGVDAFPVCLDIKDPEELIRTVKVLQPSFGGINLEDLKAETATARRQRGRPSPDSPA